MEPVSLIGVVADVLRDSNETDPDRLSDEVMGRIARNQYGPLLRQAVRSMIGSRAAAARAGSIPSGAVVSRKAVLIREQWWPSFLSQRIMGADGALIRLADASAADLRAQSAVNRDRAFALVQRADQYEALADLMDRSRVRTLGELDSSVARDVVGVAA